MDTSSAARGQQSPELGMPAALLEYLAAMRIGAEAAFECEFARTRDEESGVAIASEERE